MESENIIEDSPKIKGFRSVDGEDECLKFGYARFRPAFLQSVNKLWCFLVVLMLFCIVQGMFNHFVLNEEGTAEKPSSNNNCFFFAITFTVRQNNC